MWSFIFDILNLVILIITLIVLNFYLPAYAKAKAENLAKKQDIQELTGLVRDIEFKFDEKLQELKANLDLSTQMQMSLHIEEKKILIDLHLKVIQYYHCTTDVTFDNSDFSKSEEVDQFLNNRSKLSNEVQTAYIQFGLITDYDQELDDYLHDFVNQLNQFAEELFDFSIEITGMYRNKASLATITSTHENYTKKVESLVDFLGPRIPILTNLMRQHIHSKTNIKNR